MGLSSILSHEDFWHKCHLYLCNHTCICACYILSTYVLYSRYTMYVCTVHYVCMYVYNYCIFPCSSSTYHYGFVRRYCICVCRCYLHRRLKTMTTSCTLAAYSRLRARAVGRAARRVCPPPIWPSRMSTIAKTCCPVSHYACIAMTARYMHITYNIWHL